MPKTAKKSKKAVPAGAAAVDDILSRGVVDIIPRGLFEQKLKKGERIRVYYGVDPTGPEIHLGHAVILRKLRQLQDLGHEVILLIGDFTARIGDPTDRDAARTTMTHKEILDNAKTYNEQASKILDFSRSAKNPAQLMYNAKWLDKLRFQDVIELTSHFTVQQMMERDMYQRRLVEDKPIYVHEFLYPVMQGYDSVAMDVDMEVGGNDQLFNMLAGRTLQKTLNDREKIVMTFELLEGTDGRKMSKSYGNVVGVMDEPFEMYGKIMSLSDDLIVRYFQLCTDVEPGKIESISKELNEDANPRDVKMRLAKEIITLYHSKKDAEAAEIEFVSVFQEKHAPTEMGAYTIGSKDKTISDLIVNAGLAQSKGEARRLVEQGGVRIDDEKVEDPHALPEIQDGDVLRVGKRKFVQLNK
ncbi:MAG: tyrosine--tRNA ligase [Candidatus Kerfeldbacteria bacterium]